MSKWGEGYTTDVQYSAFFHGDFAPPHLALAAAITSKRSPSAAGGYSFCELGCGQGVTLNVLAASNPDADFWGIDFNPAQIANARQLADQAALPNVRFLDWSFEQALERGDELPQFDFVALHGVMSWVSPDNHARIAALLDRIVKPGGLVFASYNALPGWAQVAPFRSLVRQHYLRTPGRSDEHRDKALAFTKAFKDAGSLYFAKNPMIEAWIDHLKTQPGSYFAHEYLNDAWQAFYVTEMAEIMERARLDYGFTATLMENYDVASVPSTAVPFVLANGGSDVVWGELLRDFACNKTFRRDVYVRGLNKLSDYEQVQALAPLRFTLAKPRNEVTLKFSGPLGQAEGSPQIYGPILDAMAKAPLSVAEATALIGQENWSTALQALGLLTHSKQVVVHMPATDPEPARRLNAVIANAYLCGPNFGVLAAPAARTGVQATGQDMLVLDAMRRGVAAEPEAIAADVLSRLDAAKKAIVRDGVHLQGAAALDYVREQVTAPLLDRMPLYARLGML